MQSEKRSLARMFPGFQMQREFFWRVTRNSAGWSGAKPAKAEKSVTD
jgi:hypothetical protein